MPGYVQRLIDKFKHGKPTKPQYSPYKAAPKIYGKGAHNPIPDDTTVKLDNKRIKRIQRVVGGVLYYAKAVDLTTLPGLSSIASEQAQATEQTEMKVQQLLDYLATRPEARVRYYRSNMVLNIHSDASYLSELRARSRVAGYFYLRESPGNRQPITLNGAVYVFGGI